MVDPELGVALSLQWKVQVPLRGHKIIMKNEPVGQGYGPANGCLVHGLPTSRSAIDRQTETTKIHKPNHGLRYIYIYAVRLFEFLQFKNYLSSARVSFQSKKSKDS